MNREAKSVAATPEWETYCRRLHATARLAEALGRELMRASGGRKNDPEFRTWLQELADLNTQLRDRAQKSFIAFADSYESGGLL